MSQRIPTRYAALSRTQFHTAAYNAKYCGEGNIIHAQYYYSETFAPGRAFKQKLMCLQIARVCANTNARAHAFAVLPDSLNSASPRCNENDTPRKIASAPCVSRHFPTCAHKRRESSANDAVDGASPLALPSDKLSGQVSQSLHTLSHYLCAASRNHTFRQYFRVFYDLIRRRVKLPSPLHV